MRPLTVLQLVPALGAGGAERSTIEIAQALVRNGDRALVVSAGGPWVSRLIEVGGEHHALDVGSKSLSTLFRARALRALLDATRPDIVHARSRLPAWVARLALRGRRAPAFVTTVHGLNSPGLYSAVMTRGERVICVSRTVLDYVRHHYPQVPREKLVVIPRGVDRAAWPYGHQPTQAWRDAFFAEFPALRDRPFLVLPGRGTRLKGHHDAIRALARLRGAHAIDATLLLLGAREPHRADYVAELEALVRELALDDHVAIAAPRGDVREVYAAASAVLQLSNKPEAFGRTVVEALALGVPVIGYAHGGVGELLAELFPPGAVGPGDVDQVAAKARATIESRPHVAPFDGYTLEAMQAATLALYHELVP